MSKRRTLEAFFDAPSVKKARLSTPPPSDLPPSSHETYPYPVPRFPPHIAAALSQLPASDGREVRNRPELDLVHFRPYIPRPVSRPLFDFLRRSLFFYRVQYSIRRGSVETRTTTPRYTTVFGVDESSRFDADGRLEDAAAPGRPALSARYRTCRPRPLPHCLDELRRLVEAATGARYNFCLVNYYASGADSIAYHSDDEPFLGRDPTVASLSLGATRDFLLKHKPGPVAPGPPLGFALASGDMLVMRGATQANWLHSVPKRAGRDRDRGRINITFRRALTGGGTENYYRYNVGGGDVYRWDEVAGEMKPWDCRGEETEKDEDDGGGGGV